MMSPQSDGFRCTMVGMGSGRSLGGINPVVGLIVPFVLLYIVFLLILF